MRIYVSLGCLKWRRLAGVYPGRVGRGGRGVVCVVESRAAASPPPCSLTFRGGEASRPPPFKRARGRSSQTEHVRKKNGGVEGLPHFSAVAPSGVSQQRRVGELGGARERPSLRHVASGGTEVFVQRASGGREGGDAGGSAGSVCLCTGLFCLPGRA